MDLLATAKKTLTNHLKLNKTVSKEEKLLVIAYLSGEVTASQAVQALASAKILAPKAAVKTTGAYLAYWVNRCIRSMALDGEVTFKLK